MALPKTLRNFNLFVEGFSLAGMAEEITLPKLSRKMEEYRGAGMHGPIDLDMGLEKLELDFSLKEYNKEILKSFGVHDASGVGLRFVGAIQNDADTAKAEAVEVTVRGRWKELDFGSVKTGEAATLKVTMPLTYIKYDCNGETLMEIDLIAGTEVIGGVDRLAELNTILTQ